jgi:paraquat-inducible protein B
MSDEPPIAIVDGRLPRRRLSLVWSIPAVTLLIAGWLAWDTLSRRGPEITIRFDAASGLQPDQSHIRHRDVDLGVVKKVSLSPDRRYVIVTARMTREAIPMLTDKAQLWVVKPRFFAGSVSGLETLVSGTYIQLEPADGGEATDSFVGLEDPPVVHSTVPGHSYTLTTPRLGSLNPGSPILFRDLTVGEVLGWELGKDAAEVKIHAFVRTPYDKYVHQGSIFWNASGASLELGGSGVKLQLESLKALVLGAIAFETSSNAAKTPMAEDDHGFMLFPDRDAADASTFGHRLHLVTYFKGSAAGLAPGAPVVFLGMRIGTVAHVGLHYDAPTDSIVVSVRYDIEPDRIDQLRLPGGEDLDNKILDLVRRGLRVRLDSASLLTGSKQLTMDIMPGMPPAPLKKIGESFILPPVDGDQGDIASSARMLIARISAIPFEEIGDNLNKTLAGANGTINDPKLREAIAALSETLVTTRELLTTLDKGADPLLKKLPAIAQKIDETVTHANHLVASLDDNHGESSQFGRDTTRLMSQLTDTARSIRMLADLLARHPEALIRGRAEQEVR